MNHRTLFRWILAVSSMHVAALGLGHAALAQSAEAQLERAPVASRDSKAFTFEGSVQAPDGTPAVGSVVVSSAGGQAVCDAEGEFRLEARAQRAAETVQVTAVGRSSGQWVASRQVQLSVGSNLVSVGSLQLAQSSACTPSWLPTFGGEPGTDNRIHAIAVFDAGTGPELYVGGNFTTAGGVPASSIARWNGSSWKPLNRGLNGGVLGQSFVFSLLAFDDGNGPALYAGGNFTVAGITPANFIAKWDGSSWAPVGGGMASSASFGRVSALAEYDDGSGAALYAGGFFVSAGGAPANNIAKWNGSSWTPLGTGLDSIVEAMAVFDDGSGPALYAGGDFNDAGGVLAYGMAKWDGATWAAADDGGFFRPNALAVFDDGGGKALYAAGGHTLASGVGSLGVAKWDGSSWTPIPSGLAGNGALINSHALSVFDDGSGAALYLGGKFQTVDGVLANSIAKWDGSSWTTLGRGLNLEVFAMAVSDVDGMSKLYSGGTFTEAGGLPASRLASWDGSKWAATSTGLNNRVDSLAVFDDGGGDALYAGGRFSTSGGVARMLAKWNGSSWAPLGNGATSRMNGSVTAMTVFDDGSGPALYAGGEFTSAGPTPASLVAKWNGSSWSPLGSGLGNEYGDSAGALALAVFDDGNGAALYVGGLFLSAGGSAANHVAKWDGSSWTPLGSGTNTTVSSLAVFDDGSGAALYAGGWFNTAGGLFVREIAKWDGTSWSGVGGGVTRGPSGARIEALAVFDDGSGAALFAGGNFDTAGSVSTNFIAKWDGSNWAGIGNNDGLFGVRAMTVHDDGSGDALYLGGLFSMAGGLATSNIAKWDGLNWSTLGGGTQKGIFALTSFDDGNGAALFAGGNFSYTLDSGDSFLARWGCPSSPFEDSCNGDGGDQLSCTNCPCTNNASPGTIGGCLNSSLTAARLVASGDPSVSLPPGDTIDLRFALTSAQPNAFCLLTSGDSVAPTNPANPCFGLESGIQASAYDGLRCAVINTRRHGGRAADANGDVGVTNTPWGGEGGPPAGIASAGAGFAAGQTRVFQVINRDDPLAQCMRGLNTSQAVRVVFTP